VASKKRSSKSKNVVAAVRNGGVAKPWNRKRIWEGFKSIAATLAIFLILRTFFIGAYRIPSGSMIPALLIGDMLFVNNLRFGPHIPFTKVNLPGYAEPQRGDIVVFVSPPQFDQPNDLTPTLVKRLIGMPGDTIHSREGVVHINGVAQHLGYAAASNGTATSVSSSEDGVGDLPSPAFDWQRSIAITDSLPWVGPAPVRPTLDDWGPLVVPEGHYWMMGDSRYNSKDSRYWGVVPRANVRGRPLFVYYSWNADDSDRPLPFITDIRWSRLFHVIR
jgi:signal peptidase I